MAPRKVSESNVINVKNASGDPDTTAKIIVQNNIDYTPAVSVIMPVYNGERYLRECLDSVVNQTLKNIEIICVDDGSTDGSLSILREYASQDPRITILAQENLHAGVARNAGLTVARGEYLSFLDCDDKIKPSAYETLVKCIEENKDDLVLCGWNFIANNPADQSGCSSNYLNFSGKVNLTDNVKKNMNFEIWNKLFKRYLVDSNDIKFSSAHFGEDVVFTFQYLMYCKSIFFLNEQLYLYRIHNTGLMGQLYASTKIFDGTKSWVHLSELLRNRPDLCEQHMDFFAFRINSHLNWSNKWFKAEAEFTNWLEYIRMNIVQYIDDKYLAEYPNLKLLAERNYVKLSKELQNPFLSVIIPVYNAETFLSQCLDSILGQVNVSLEIICVNDGSTDDSLAILQKYAKNNRNITIVDKPNSGAGDCRNVGLEHARGQYVHFMDADDWVVPGAYFSICETLKKQQPDMVKFKSYVYEHDSDSYAPNAFFALKNIPANLFGRCVNLKQTKSLLKLPNSPWSGMYNRKFLKNHQIHFNNLKCVNDVSFFVWCTIEAKKILVYDSNVVVYRINNSNSLIGVRFKHFDCLFKNFFIVENILSHSSRKIKTQIRALLLEDIVFWIEKAKKANLPLDLYRKIMNSYKMFLSCLSLRVLATCPQMLEDKQNNSMSEYKDMLKAWYKNVCKTDLNLYNPKTFNEKIQWLKLYDSTPIKTRLADKYLVRDWVAKKIGEQYLIPLLGVCDKFEEIDFDKLPDRFVIKCNHGCAYNIIVKDKSKLDLNDVKAKLDKWMAEDFALKFGLELHYRDIPHKIIIEEFIENKKSGGDLYDYKFWCFDGHVEYIQFLSERNTDGLKMAFYDKKWNKQDFVYSYPLDTKTIEKPDNLDEMIKMAEKLSDGFGHVRVDFYRMDDGKIYFGEMTFTSASGSCKWNDEKINRYFGNLIKLPRMAYNIDTGEYYSVPHRNHLKSYLLFPWYLVKLAKMRKKLKQAI